MICHEKKAWALEALESVFVFSLELKSKCLIQACVINAEQEFSGVSSFSQETQLKFLLESALHIIEDNCQKEYIHILQYLDSVNSQFPDITCQEEFTRSMLKLKQLFILYNILENGRVSNICFLMDDLFPPDDLLKGMLIAKTVAKKRFLSSIRREILSFKRLVNKLLTNIEYRQYYFFEECFDDFGESCHKQLISDVGIYLAEVEQRLVGGNANSISTKRRYFSACHNPALLYFFKILANKAEDLTEFEVLSFLKWMFISFDESILTMPATNCLKVPEIFNEEYFERILSKRSRVLREHPPWKFDSFDEFCEELQKGQQSIYMPVVKTEPIEDIDQDDLFANSQSSTKCLRVVLKDISSQSTNTSLSENSPMRTPININMKLIHNMGKTNNLLSSTESSQMKIMPNFDTPQSQKLLASGSKFFSPERNIVINDTPPQLCTEILDSGLMVQFSDEEAESDTVDESCNLRWLHSSATIGSTPKSKALDISKSCRSLSFEYDSSDAIISESDVEEDKRRQPCVRMLDNSYVPDLSWCLEEPAMKPCTVNLRRLNDVIAENGAVDGIRVCADDLVVIRRGCL